MSATNHCDLVGVLSFSHHCLTCQMRKPNKNFSPTPSASDSLGFDCLLPINPKWREWGPVVLRLIIGIHQNVTQRPYESNNFANVSYALKGPLVALSLKIRGHRG